MFDTSGPGSHTVEIPSESQEILECVERALRATLGESPAAATLYFIESKGSMTLSRIPGDPGGFADALRTIFGRGSAELLKSILRELRSKETKLERGKPLHDFSDVIEMALESVEAGII